MQPGVSSRISLEMPREPIDAFGEALRRLDESKRTGATLLITDLDLAMTFTRIAGDAAEDSKRRNRNRANARRAYDEVSRISSHASLTPDERQTVDEKLAALRSELEELGEAFT